MTPNEWNLALDYLEQSETGAWVEENGRTAIVENMCGGRYLLTENNEIVGLVDEEWKALHFIQTGKVL